MGDQAAAVAPRRSRPKAAPVTRSTAEGGAHTRMLAEAPEGGAGEAAEAAQGAGAEHDTGRRRSAVRRCGRSKFRKEEIEIERKSVIWDWDEAVKG